MESETQRHFSDAALSLAQKISIYDIRLTKRDVFPLSVFQSDFLRKGLDNLKLKKNIHKKIKHLIKLTQIRKAFTYLFWIFVAFKFSKRSFGDIDHYSGQDPKVLDLKDASTRL